MIKNFILLVVLIILVTSVNACATTAVDDIHQGEIDAAKMCEDRYFRLFNECYQHMSECLWDGEKYGWCVTDWSQSPVKGEV